jgi:hypothetical protein
MSFKTELPSSMPYALTEDVAARFARIALGHVTREYPNHLSHGLSGPKDAQTPRELRPLFYGSFDWHSCVHAYMLTRLWQLYPEMASPKEERGRV